MAKTYNDALEWAATWIEDTLRAGPETNERTIEFGTNMAMTLRAAKEDGADLPRTTVDVDDDVPRGFWPTLVDRGDGIKGHYCIGRLIEPDKSYWEFWNHGQWLSAGQVFIGKKVALATLAKIRATPRATGETTVGECLAELREMFPGETFKVEMEEAVRMGGGGDISQLRKSALILRCSLGLDGFFTAQTLADCMAQVRAATRTEVKGEKVDG